MGTDHNLSKNFGGPPSAETLVDKLKREIEANLNNEQFGVDDLAKAIGMSRSSLHRKLQRKFGISTSQFIREYRLKKALEILKNEDVTVSEVAFRVGFGSATYFSSSFRKFYGFPPGEVKSRAEKETQGPLTRTTTEGKSDPLIFNFLTRKKAELKKPMFWVIFGLLLLTTTLLSFYFSENRADTKDKIPEEKSIAVLPFRNLTGNTDLEYISDGMTDAVISRLSKIKSLDKVPPFTSMLKYKRTNKALEEIAAELGVSNVLEGNVQLSGEQIKINLRLVDGISERRFWSKEFMGVWNSDEIFALQAQVAENIAGVLNASIATEESESIQKILTNSPQAYANFLQAEFQRNKASESAYNHAIPLYEKAIALDSNFVEAYVGLANIWSFGGLVWGIYEEQKAWENAKELLEKALKIDNSDAEVEEELYSGYFYYDWDFERVEPYYQKLQRHFYFDATPSIKVDYAIKTGRYEGALETMDTYISLDPTVGVFFSFKAEALMFLGRQDEALKLLGEADNLFNDNWFYLREAARHYYYLGAYEKWRKHLAVLQSQFSDYPPILMWFNTVNAHMEGKSETASIHLNELKKKHEEGASGSPAWYIAMYYGILKQYDKTFEWLLRSYERHEAEMTWLREEPLLAPIRNDPRYKDLYEKVGFSSIGLPIKPALKGQLP